jgi:hypothetical protein
MRGMTTIAALLVMTAAGCDEAFHAGGASTVTPMFTTITQRDLRGLDAEERLAIELDGPYPLVVEFDGRREQIDFDRLEITTPDGKSIAMSIWLAHKAASHGVDLEGLPSRRFRLANDRDAGLGGLSEPAPQFRACEAVEVAEIDELIAVMFVDGGEC